MSFYSQMSWLCRKSKGVCMHTLVHTLELINKPREVAGYKTIHKRSENLYTEN